MLSASTCVVTHELRAFIYLFQDSVTSTNTALTVSNTQPKCEDPDEKGLIENKTQQNITQCFYTVCNNPEDIVYTPEDALKEGSGMVKTIKENLKKLELGSKLRQEVWDREMAKLVFIFQDI